MGRYIDADQIEQTLCESSMPQKYKNFCRRIIRDKIITPTADVKAVTHGCWIVLRIDDNSELPVLQCSNCLTKTFGTKPYCPNCGTKMDGERKDEE